MLEIMIMFRTSMKLDMILMILSMIFYSFLHCNGKLGELDECELNELGEMDASLEPTPVCRLVGWWHFQILSVTVDKVECCKICFVFSVIFFIVFIVFIVCSGLVWESVIHQSFILTLTFICSLFLSAILIFSVWYWHCTRDNIH